MPFGHSNLQLPNENSYWVRPGRFMAGEYPGHQRSIKAKQRLREYLESGVTFFLDLTEPGELRSYSRFLWEVCADMGVFAEHCRMPIRNGGVPSNREYMQQILDVVDNAIEDGHVVYAHCWGGIGRTGLVVGCYLVRHGLTGEQALAELARLWRGVQKSDTWPTTPETEEQENWIRTWVEPPRPKK